MEKIGNDYHIPVLYYETLDNLVINPDGIYIEDYDTIEQTI